MPDRLPTPATCPIGSLGLHTFNAERTECIWCGPNALAWKPGRWVQMKDEAGSYTAWSADCEAELEGASVGDVTGVLERRFNTGDPGAG